MIHTRPSSDLDLGNKSRNPDELRMGDFTWSIIQVIRTKEGDQEALRLLKAIEDLAAKKVGPCVVCEYKGLPRVAFGMDRKRIMGSMHVTDGHIEEERFIYYDGNLPQSYLQKFTQGRASGARLSDIISMPFPGFNPAITGFSEHPEFVTFKFQLSSKPWIARRNEIIKTKSGRMAA